MSQWLREHEFAVLLLTWLALCGGALSLAATADGPGMLYDEAWLAQQGRQVVDPLREGLMPPGTQKTWLFGRPFPLFALPYLGSLKSQLLVPAIAMFGNELAAVRGATLGVAMLALLATLAVARRIFGLRVALLTGALLASDPTVFFHAQWEWGPFTTGWLCRATGALLLLRGYSEMQRAATLTGAFALGLGVYNRADFVLIGLACLLGLAIFHAPALRALWRTRRGELIGACAVFLLGALPMLLNARRVFGTMGDLTTRGDLTERIQVLISTLDGSYAYRLMAAGGRYEILDQISAPTALLALACAVAVVACLVEAVRRGPASLRDGRGVLAVACVGIAAAMLALPGATRAHHMLNLTPFVQLLVGAQLVRGIDAGGTRRAVAALASAALILTGATVIETTRSLIRETGGRGWWSDQIAGVGEELDQEPGAVAVSLDWGFHLQLLFSTDNLIVLEPFWQIGSALASQGVWSHRGDERHVYLVHDEPYDRFGFGPRFLATARQLGDRALIRAHQDREGEPAFFTVRVNQPHTLFVDRSGYSFGFD
jgi:hypothetical protein